MNRYVIIMYSELYNGIINEKFVAKKYRFNGNYHDARIEANRLLYSNCNYTGYTIEMDF